MRSRRYLLAMLLVSAAALPAAAQERGSLRPGDGLRLRVFREPELSGEFVVNERGDVTLPRLGDLPVGSWPADSIRPRLTRLLGDFLRDATVEVVLLRRIAITGSVLKPGLYPVDPTMTLSDVLALAGGPSPDGRRDRVELIRDGRTIVERLDGSSAGALVALRSGDRLHVAQRGWIARNTWLVGSIIGATATVVAVLAR